MERRLAAIVSADVVGYSRMIAADEGGTLARWRALRGMLIDPRIAEHAGRIVKTMGDGLLLEFPSVVNAVKCSIAIQEALAQRMQEVAEAERIVLRVGINLGDIAIEDGDIHGDGVNVAARLQASGEPGGIAISGIAYESLGSLVDAAFEDRGQQTFKNIVRPIRTWHWVPRPSPMELPSGRGAAAAAPTDRPSIAVLPFDNRSSDPEQDYFSDGISEDIITELSRLPGLLVISRNSSFTYKGRPVKVQEVCRDLGVRYLLEGSVRKAGPRVRVSAQLIDGRNGGHLWAERYDRSLDDIFAVQDDVTRNIVRALQIRLVGDGFGAETRKETANPAAYDCVLRGREFYRRFSRNGNAAARAVYEEAIALDPSYAEPYAGIAETYVQDWFGGVEPSLDRAFDMAREAAARDPDLALVQEALSTVHLFRREHDEAVATARRWTQLEPGNAEAYAALAGALHFSGDNAPVVTLIETAMRLNPFYPFYYPHYLGLAQMMLRRFEEAGEAFLRAIALNPDVLWPQAFLASCLGHLDRPGEAADRLAEVRRIDAGFSIASPELLLPYKRSEDVDLLLEGLKKAGLGVA